MPRLAEANAELSAAELDQVRRGFRRTLLKLRFSPQFIAANFEELLASAQVEYARHLDKGARIENPVAWIILCAWHRTVNHLATESSGPEMVSAERIAELADSSPPLAERVVQDAERARLRALIQPALEELSLEERAVIALLYFEDMSLRQAGRALDWSHSKTVRRQRSALGALRRSLGVKRGDQLLVEAGALASLSLPGGHPAAGLIGDLAAPGERIANGALGLWLRAHELLRRLGADPASALANSGAGRALGVCGAAAAVACFASGGALLSAGAEAPALLSHPTHSDAPSRHRRAGIYRRAETTAPIAPAPGQIEAPAKEHPYRRHGAEPTPGGPQAGKAEFGPDAVAGEPVPPASPRRGSAPPSAPPPPPAGEPAPRGRTSEFGV